MVWYARPPTVVALARRTSYLFIVSGSAIVLADIDVDEMARVLALTAHPVTSEQLAMVCEEDTIRVLLDLGVLAIRTEGVPIESPDPPAARRCKRLVVGLSGSISVVYALDHLAALTTFADQIDVVLSAGACRFVQPRVFEYHGFRTWTDAYEPSHGVAVPHKHLADADLILVAPASANTIHRLATGACSDLISLVVAFTKAPVVVAPSMNHQMWAHPPIARNVAQLRADGLWVIDPGLGFPLSQPTRPELGALGFDPPGLLRALDCVLTQHASATG